MTTVMKIVFNMRHTSDTNTSVSFEHIVTDEEDAKESGEQDQLLMAAYLEGFGQK